MLEALWADRRQGDFLAHRQLFVDKDYTELAGGLNGLARFTLR